MVSPRYLSSYGGSSRK